MTRWNKITLAGLAVAAALVVWLHFQHAHQVRQLPLLKDQVRIRTEEFKSRKAVLDDLEQQRKTLLEEKSASENTVVVSLIRERAAAATVRSMEESAAKAEQGRAFRNALANTMDDPQEKETNRELLRQEIGRNIAPLAKKLNLTPERTEQLRNSMVENELRKNDRVAALLREKMTVADALRDRNFEHKELQREMRSVLGDEGYAELLQVRQKGNVERILRWLNKELAGHTLDAGQSARLGSLIYEEFANVPVDDTDVFRTPQDWEQFILERQQNIIRQISPFLTVEQVEGLGKLAADDRSKSHEALASKRKSYGLPPW